MGSRRKRNLSILPLLNPSPPDSNQPSSTSTTRKKVRLPLQRSLTKSSNLANATARDAPLSSTRTRTASAATNAKTREKANTEVAVEEKSSSRPLPTRPNKLKLPNIAKSRRSRLKLSDPCALAKDATSSNTPNRSTVTVAEDATTRATVTAAAVNRTSQLRNSLKIPSSRPLLRNLTRWKPTC